MKKTLLCLSVSHKAVAFTGKLFLLLSMFLLCFYGDCYAGNKPVYRKVTVSKGNAGAGKLSVPTAFFSDGAIGANYDFSCYPQGAATALASSSAATVSYTFVAGTACQGDGFTATAISDANTALNIVPNATNGTYVRAVKSTGGHSTALSMKSTSGAEFKLTNLGVIPVSGGAVQTLTVQGYKDGSAVSGAIVTISYTGGTQHKTTLTSTDFGSNFDNIDEFRISTSINFGVGATNIQTTTPVVPVTLNSLTLVNSTPNNGSAVQYTASFSGSIAGLGTSNFTTTGSTVSGSSVSGISGSGATYTITVNTGTGDGNVQLNFANTTNISGGTITNTLPVTSPTYTIDKTAPSVTAITATTPANTNPTNATSLIYTVSFNETVTGVDASDFTVSTLSGNAAGSVSGVTGSGNTYQVTLSSVSGNGSLRLDLNSSGTNIVDGTGNPISGGFTTGDVYTIDTTVPTLTSGSYFSNNGFSSQYAKVGDNITLSIGYNEVLQSLTMTIGGNAVSVTPSNGNQNWTGVYTMTSADIEGNVPWTLHAVDLAGNVRNYTNNDFGTLLIFDKTPPTPSIRTLTLTSVPYRSATLR
jgi:hypothetical protein